MTGPADAAGGSYATVLTAGVASLGLLGGMRWLRGSSPNDNVKKEAQLQLNYLEDIGEITAKPDCVIVLGGGKPVAQNLPPPWAASRCDAAIEIYQKVGPVHILCLSGGTAHASQLMNAKGLPVWESEASAMYMIERGVDPKHISMETSSYDTIGNAYFARVSFTDIQGWRNLVVVTSKFHMNRTKACFEWIYGAAPKKNYCLSFLSSEDMGLEPNILKLRMEREESRASKTIDLKNKYPSLKSILTFLSTEHGMYAPAMMRKPSKVEISDEVKQSYVVL